MAVLQSKSELVGACGKNFVNNKTLFIGISYREESGHTHISVVMSCTHCVVMIPDGTGLLIHGVQEGPLRSVLTRRDKILTKYGESGCKPGTGQSIVFRTGVSTMDMSGGAVIREAGRCVGTAVHRRVMTGGGFVREIVQPLHTNRTSLDPLD